ncbi:hypothetical protein J1N35_029477, partial [Gossypium stocksii]
MEDELGSNHHNPTLYKAFKIIQDLLQIPIGLITRARAKRFREALNGLMRWFWSQAQSNLDRIGSSPNPTLAHLVH